MDPQIHQKTEGYPPQPRLLFFVCLLPINITLKITNAIHNKSLPALLLTRTPAPNCPHTRFAKTSHIGSALCCGVLVDNKLAVSFSNHNSTDGMCYRRKFCVKPYSMVTIIALKNLTKMIFRGLFLLHRWPPPIKIPPHPTSPEIVLSRKFSLMPCCPMDKASVKTVILQWVTYELHIKMTQHQDPLVIVN